MKSIAKLLLVPGLLASVGGCVVAPAYDGYDRGPYCDDACYYHRYGYYPYDPGYWPAYYDPYYGYYTSPPPRYVYVPVPAPPPARPDPRPDDDPPPTWRKPPREPPARTPQERPDSDDRPRAQRDEKDNAWRRQKRDKD